MQRAARLLFFFLIAAVLGDPTFKHVIDASLEHDRQVEKKEAAWLARYAR